MRTCFVCDSAIAGPQCFRLRIGGVLYGDDGAKFSQRDEDQFEDGSQQKWICPTCATNAGIWIEELDRDVCLGADEDGDTCGMTFNTDPWNDESVILVEWGQIRTSHKGPSEIFCADVSKHVHYLCACFGWPYLQLDKLQATDCP